jgi:hypothetical protein
MSSSQSNLSSAGYGYDFVVATTQASINTTMKEFLSSGTMPVVNICYVADPNGNPTQIDYETLKTNAHGSDPFSVPSGADPNSDQDLKNLIEARFMVGFRAQIGLPGGYAPADVPDVVTLSANGTAVAFTLMCSEFQVLQLVPGGGYNTPTWMNASQPDGNAWLFTSNVNLQTLTTDPSAYDQLPPAVRQGVDNLGADAFSVQQLLFDLDNAALESIPTMSGVQPGTTLYTVLQTDFLGTYFQAMKAQGSPILGCAIQQSSADPSSLVLSSFELETSPMLNADGSRIADPTPAQQQLATLCYLCEADNHPPIATRQFGWNWIDAGDEGADGVVAINRDTFADYFETKLTPQITRSCYNPYTHVWLSGIFDQNVHFEWNMTGYQTPTVTRPESGSTVLKYDWSGYCESDAGAGGDMGHLTLSSTMTCSVEFIGNTIVITQHLVVWIYASCMATSASGNVVDKQITDTYTIAVDASGHLTASAPASVPVDHSDNPSANPFLNWFVDIQSIIDAVASWLTAYVQTDFTDIPVSPVQAFVFPGGDTFAFKDVSFSDNQDLVGRVTYADPTTVHLCTSEMLAGTGTYTTLPMAKVLSLQAELDAAGTKVVR